MAPYWQNYIDKIFFLILRNFHEFKELSKTDSKKKFNFPPSLYPLPHLCKFLLVQKSTELNLHIYLKKSAEKKDRKIVIFLFLFLNFVSLLCRKPKVIMIIMLINLSKLLLCTTLKSFYAVKKVKQTKKRKEI